MHCHCRLVWPFFILKKEDKSEIFISWRFLRQVNRGRSQLFHRAVLMSGSSLAASALVADPRDVTRQVWCVYICEARTRQDVIVYHSSGVRKCPQILGKYTLHFCNLLSFAQICLARKVDGKGGRGRSRSYIWFMSSNQCSAVSNIWLSTMFPRDFFLFRFKCTARQRKLFLHLSLSARAQQACLSYGSAA